MDPQRRHQYSQRRRRPARQRRLAIVALVVLAVSVGVGLAALTGLGRPSVAASLDPGQVAAGGNPSFVPPSHAAPPSEIPSTTPIASLAPSSSANPSPTPVPTPNLVPAPLDGVLVTPKVAAQHPIAVMVDDLSPARPQSGFNSASVVWQAPAEGGIPRYMLVFQETIPKLVGPVRSARYYYIAWAAELHAVYAHAGGSPQALQTLRLKGNGQLVYNADEFRWGNSFWRVTNRFPPHNLYTDGRHLRGIARSVGAKDQQVDAPWSFAPDLARSLRPRGGRIDMGYLANHIRYDYDWRTNTYLRSVTGEKGQVDAATGTRVAPKNVVVMLMKFGPLGSGYNHGRLEAQVTGQGTAWIATNGTTIKGTWRKASLTTPTQFFDSSGQQVVLTVGQTFINVLQTGSAVTLKAGSPPPPEPVRGDLIPN
jgi:Protein of unknown function (DUF3048) N-terminal domain/Protein of unknown function (DUF3048) C-terminal domain